LFHVNNQSLKKDIKAEAIVHAKAITQGYHSLHRSLLHREIHFFRIDIVR